MSNKEVTKLIRQIERWPGWQVKEGSSGYVVYPADKDRAPIPIHKTPSGRRWKANTVSRLHLAAPLSDRTTDEGAQDGVHRRGHHRDR